MWLGARAGCGGGFFPSHRPPLCFPKITPSVWVSACWSCYLRSTLQLLPLQTSRLHSKQRKESKKPPAKLQPRGLEAWLRPEDGTPAEGAEDELEIRFDTPFDVGIKLSGAQDRRHGQALGKFLQDMFWEEADGKSLPESSPFRVPRECQM
ncbi:appetite-regulating hormone isoform X3 [Phyllostomus discolor]|uniref:Appetite-regulating hormone n=1 Tax=Phyllostomus discolor TaxID=89673 RepID=A0A7E6E549_9CHIR|nr:appetite-regulating hormone isoform X3 [Phyllostomus discolor]